MPIGSFFFNPYVKEKMVEAGAVSHCSLHQNYTPSCGSGSATMHSVHSKDDNKAIKRKFLNELENYNHLIISVTFNLFKPEVRGKRRKYPSHTLNLLVQDVIKA
jgi:hypothetical protein